MTGYTHFWNCRLCNERQETIDNPRNPICDKCMRPLANALCFEKFKVDLQAGIDESHFLTQAQKYADILMRRWKNTPS